MCVCVTPLMSVQQLSGIICDVSAKFRPCSITVLCCGSLTLDLFHVLTDVLTAGMLSEHTL